LIETAGVAVPYSCAAGTDADDAYTKLKGLEESLRAFFCSADPLSAWPEILINEVVMTITLINRGFCDKK